MKLKHTRYSEVTVMCKGKPVVFTGGIAILTDNTLVKELLKNPYVKEVVEASVIEEAKKEPEVVEEPETKAKKEGKK